MKRNFLLILLIAFSSSQIVTAQIKKGTTFVGGQIGFSSYKIDNENITGDQTATTFSISPAIGGFIKDNLVIGGSIFYQRSKNKLEAVADNTGINLGAGFFIRQYME